MSRDDRAKPADRDSGSWRVAAVHRFVPAGLVGVIGLVGIVATTGTTSIVGAALVTAGVMLAISFAFLEVGYSEDRERAREQRRITPPPAGNSLPRRARL